jgi:hypothetical protein
MLEQSPPGDPVLFEATAYREARRRNATLRRTHYAAVVSRARRARDHEMLSGIQELLAASDLGELPDLLYGRTLCAWIWGLELGLRRIAKGEDPACLAEYCDLTAFELDLATEYPHLGLGGHRIPFELLHGSIAVVPLEALACSPRFGARIRNQFPRLARGTPEPHDRRAFQAGVRHLDDALTALRALGLREYQGVTENLHSIGLSLLPREHEMSTSSRANEPGSAIMGIPTAALERQDLPFTASLLYHEHAHNKLALHAATTPLGLDPTPHFVSPFVNVNRSAEPILHQVYSFSMECSVRLRLLGDAAVEAAEYLAGKACRLALTSDLLPLIPAGAALRPLVDDLATVSAWAMDRIAVVVASAPVEVRRRCEADRARVHKRHISDIGQSLLRGIVVHDRGLESWRPTDDGVQYDYRGVEYTAIRTAAGPQAAAS